MPAPLSSKTPLERAERLKQRIGIFFCLFYALVYAGFVVISVYDVTLMDTIMWRGLNLATFYGLGLIVLALILAIIYSKSCTFIERKADKKSLRASDPKPHIASGQIGEGGGGE